MNDYYHMLRQIALDVQLQPQRITISRESVSKLTRMNAVE